MARSVGGHIPGPTLAAAPVAAWTDPAIGNLVIWDTAANMAVDECAADEVPLGRVIAVNPAKTVVTVELFTGGMVAVLPYSGTPARGNAVEAMGPPTRMAPAKSARTTSPESESSSPRTGLRGTWTSTLTRR